MSLLTQPTDVLSMHENVQHTLDNILVEVQTLRRSQKEVLDVNETAAFLNTAKSNIYKMIKRDGEHRIPHTKLGKRLAFVKSELLTWLIARSRSSSNLTVVYHE